MNSLYQTSGQHFAIMVIFQLMHPLKKCKNMFPFFRCIQGVGCLAKWDMLCSLRLHTKDFKQKAGGGGEGGGLKELLVIWQYSAAIGYKQSWFGRDKWRLIKGNVL